MEEPLTGWLFVMTSGGQQDVLLLLFSPQRKTLVFLRVEDPENIFFFSSTIIPMLGPLSALSPLEVTQVLAMDQGLGGSSFEALPSFQEPRRIINEFCTPGPRERISQVWSSGDEKRGVAHLV